MRSIKHPLGNTQPEVTVELVNTESAELNSIPLLSLVTTHNLPSEFAFNDWPEQRFADFINLLNSLEPCFRCFTRWCHLTNAYKKWISAHCYSRFVLFEMLIFYEVERLFLLLGSYFYCFGVGTVWCRFSYGLSKFYIIFIDCFTFTRIRKLKYLREWWIFYFNSIYFNFLIEFHFNLNANFLFVTFVRWILNVTQIPIIFPVFTFTYSHF